MLEKSRTEIRPIPNQVWSYVLPVSLSKNTKFESFRKHTKAKGFFYVRKETWKLGNLDVPISVASGPKESRYKIPYSRKGVSLLWNPWVLSVKNTLEFRPFGLRNFRSLNPEDRLCQTMTCNVQCVGLWP